MSLFFVLNDDLIDVLDRVCGDLVYPMSKEAHEYSQMSPGDVIDMSEELYKVLQDKSYELDDRANTLQYMSSVLRSEVIHKRP